MLITTKLLKESGACNSAITKFNELFGDKVQLTVENLVTAYANGIPVFWLTNLLPSEGAGGQRDFALFAAEQVQHHSKDERVSKCIEVIRRKVADPHSVSDAELKQARKGAWSVAAADAAGAAAAAAGAWAADAAAWAAYAAACAADAAARAADAAACAADAAACAADAAARADAGACAADAGADRESMNKLLLHKLAELLN